MAEFNVTITGRLPKFWAEVLFRVLGMLADFFGLQMGGGFAEVKHE